MAITNITVTGLYTVDGSPGAGAVTFTLCQTISNGATIIPCAPLTVTLDATGTLTATLPATDDPGTIPPGVWYGVTEQINGAQPRDYFIQVSATGPNPLTLTPPGTLAWQ